MHITKQRLIKLSTQLKNDGLKDEAETIESLESLEQIDESENQRPLYEAKPTNIPGTWTDPSGDLIKTSQD